MDAKEAWKVYNFINAYKYGTFGYISLQEALDKFFQDYEDAPAWVKNIKSNDTK